MGAHFNTCLSPGGGNFFSVVTNAADINKRVLYARRAGAVVGRCLLALTDGGHLLTFEPYAHDTRIELGKLVGAFAVDLAARLRTQVATAGNVATLLGSDWYDDGAQDLVGRYAALESDAFQQAAKDVPVTGFVALVEKTLGRPLDDLTLPIVVRTTALVRRPQLIVALAARLLADRNLPDQTLVSAADRATEIGDHDLADRLMVGPAARAPLTHSVWHWGQVLARLRPSFALARLRQTRPRGVRGWNDERGERLAMAGLALEQLHRRRQAAAFYRLALVDQPWLEDDLRPRLAALDLRR
jgi:hypothetical protein